MEIENKLNHTFKSESQKLIAELLYTSNCVEQKIALAIAETGLSFQQLNVLRIISGQQEGRANVQLVKERMIDDRSNVSRLLNKLMDKGLIQKDRCVQDQRIVYLEITQEGKKLMQIGRDKIETIQFPLDESKIKTLNELLSFIRK